MINQFGKDTALVVIDAQKGVDELLHWGGVNGRRNNPDCEQRIAQLLAHWRAGGRPLIHVHHRSAHADGRFRGSVIEDALSPFKKPE